MLCKTVSSCLDYLLLCNKPPPKLKWPENDSHFVMLAVFMGQEFGRATVGIAGLCSTVSEGSAGRILTTGLT